MVRAGLPALTVAAGFILLAGCGEESPSGLAQAGDPLALHATTVLDPSICLPSRGGFTIQSTNRYFPLHAGNQWFYRGEEEGETLELLITVLDRNRVIEGVTTRVLEEREWVDDELLEVSWNYYVEAAEGTVCYYGEDVDIFEEEEIVHDGAWCADEPRNAPGIIMPAKPRRGLKYVNEIAPGIAEDEATIVRSEPVTVPAGHFTETIRIREFNPLDGDVGFKVFALGTGLVIDGPAELIRFTRNADEPEGPIPTDQTCGRL